MVYILEYIEYRVKLGEIVLNFCFVIIILNNIIKLLV